MCMSVRLFIQKQQIHIEAYWNSIIIGCRAVRSNLEVVRPLVKGYGIMPRVTKYSFIVICYRQLFGAPKVPLILFSEIGFCTPGICGYLTHSQLMPEVNSVWNPVADKSIVSSTVDVSVAVAPPNGLITLIVRSADQRTIPELVAVLRVRRGGGAVTCVAEIAADLLAEVVQFFSSQQSNDFPNIVYIIHG